MTKNCIVCEREFRISGSPQIASPRRPKHSKTCSPKCSRAFSRIKRHVYGNYATMFKKQERKIKNLLTKIKGKEK